jgi:hypothetical protein
VSGAVVTLRDVIVRDTAPLAQPLPSGERTGFGVWLQNARVTGERVRLERNAETNLLAFENGTVTLTDAVVRDPVWSDGVASGLFADRRSSLELNRVAVSRCRPVAVFGFDDTSLTLTDVSISETGPDDRGVGAAALTVNNGAQLTASRVQVDGSTGSALVLSGARLEARLSDLTITTTRADATRAGVTVAVGLGAQATFERVEVARSDSIAWTVIDPGTQARLSDVRIEDVGRSDGQGRFGYALVARGGALLTGARVSVRSAVSVGVYAFEPDTRVTVTDLSVIDIAPPPCQANCPAIVGVLTTRSAAVSASKFRVSWSNGFGVLVSQGGGLDLQDGEVSHHRIGAGVLSPGYAAQRLDQNVVYRANQTKLDATEVPLPEIPPVPRR